MKTEVIKLYEDRDDVTLTTYVLADSSELLNGKSRGAVLICPGGGYLNCSDREAEPIAMKFASMGYHAFVLRYSTYLEGKAGFPDITKDIEPKENLVYPVQMREIGQAMLIMREHASEWLVDMDKIAVCGFSAGAHNTAMYCTNWDKPVITEHFGKPAELFQPAAMILGYTLSDYIFMKECMSKGKADPIFFGISNTAYLGNKNPSEELLKEVSPARNVTANTPPTFLWATSEDNLVPVQHSLIMAKALADQNIPFEIHVFEKGDHGMGLATYASAASKSQMAKGAAEWSDLCGKWLEERFAPPLPEMTPWEEMMANEQPSF